MSGFSFNSRSIESITTYHFEKKKQRDYKAQQYKIISNRNSLSLFIAAEIFE